MLKSLLIRLKKSFKNRYNSLSVRFVYKILILLHNEKKWNNTISSDTEVLWILGMFRSGTSLTSQILKELGYDFGDDNHLIKPIGVLKDLNPNGFFENFIFAEYSRYFLNEINRSGDNPPKLGEEIKNISFNDVEYPKLIYLSLFKIKDDRVKLFNKYRAFRKLSKYGIHYYVERCFTGKVAIKIPLLSFFYEQLEKNFPNSKYLIVYRNPDSVLNSSKALTSFNDYQLYNEYHKHFLNLRGKSNVFYFSYDELLKNPTNSIEKTTLALGLKINNENIKKAISIIDSRLLRNKAQNEYINIEETKTIYEKLNSYSIN